MMTTLIHANARTTPRFMFNSLVFRNSDLKYLLRWCLLLTLGFAVAPIDLLLASPTGLNNIPTADTAGDREVVFQGYSNHTNKQDSDFFVGFKTGLQFDQNHIELGADGRLGESDPAALVLQAKYAAPLWNNLSKFAVGMANIAITESDRDDVGQPLTYFVLTRDIDWFRIHAGYGLQHNNDAAFIGIDKNVSILERDMAIRFDAIQIDDNEQWLGSAGFIYFLHEHFAVESWVSQPFEHGNPILTLKFNVIFRY